MATSGTTTFNLGIDEIIDEAISQIGGESTLGNDVREARRSLDLLLREWQNKGFSLWKTALGTFTASTSTAVETLPTNVIDIIVASCRIVSSTTDIEMNRISMEEYEKIPKKSQTGRPMQFSVQFATTGPSIYLWPLADTASAYTIRYRYFGYTDDSSKSTFNADVPRSMLPALTAGLAYKMAIKRPGIPDSRITLLKQIYDEVFDIAFTADRERSSLIIVPSFRI